MFLMIYDILHEVQGFEEREVDRRGFKARHNFQAWKFLQNVEHTEMDLLIEAEFFFS